MKIERSLRVARIQSPNLKRLNVNRKYSTAPPQYPRNRVGPLVVEVLYVEQGGRGNIRVLEK